MLVLQSIAVEAGIFSSSVIVTWKSTSSEIILASGGDLFCSLFQPVEIFFPKLLTLAHWRKVLLVRRLSGLAVEIQALKMIKNKSGSA